MTRKAQLGSALILFYSIIIIVAIFLGFFLFVASQKILSGGSTEIKAVQAKDLSSEYSLLSFLRSPLESGGSVIDLLATEKYDIFISEVRKSLGDIQFYVLFNGVYTINGRLAEAVDENRKICLDQSVLIKGEVKNVKFCIAKK